MRRRRHPTDFQARFVAVVSCHEYRWADSRIRSRPRDRPVVISGRRHCKDLDVDVKRRTLSSDRNRGPVVSLKGGFSASGTGTNPTHLSPQLSKDRREVSFEGRTISAIAFLRIGVRRSRIARHLICCFTRKKTTPTCSFLFCCFARSFRGEIFCEGANSSKHESRSLARIWMEAPNYLYK